MRSSDFASIVSPLMLASRQAPMKRAKGGKVDKGKKHLHIVILMPMGGPPQGALNAASRPAMMRGGKAR